MRAARLLSARPALAVARAVMLPAILVTAAASTAEEAGVPAVGDDVLRVCASGVQPPFSSRDGAGFENRLAEVLAAEMGRTLEVVWSDRPAIYLVRDLLDRGACDVVMGVDADDERLLTSDPYYRTGYVFISRQETDFDGDSWHDPRIASFSRFVMGFGSPGEVMLRQVGMSKYEDNAAYLFSLVNFQSRRNQYIQIPPDRMVAEVAQGHADLAVAFAPEVARYVKSSSVPLRMTVIADDHQRRDGLEVPQHFDQSVGVRKDDEALMEAIDQALQRAEEKITGILEEESIPLLNKSN